MRITECKHTQHSVGRRNKFQTGQFFSLSLDSPTHSNSSTSLLTPPPFWTHLSFPALLPFPPFQTHLVSSIHAHSPAFVSSFCWSCLARLAWWPRCLTARCNAHSPIEARQGTPAAAAAACCLWSTRRCDNPTFRTRGPISSHVNGSLVGGSFVGSLGFLDAYNTEGFSSNTEALFSDRVQ